MMKPVRRRTWAPVGQSPVLVPCAKYDRWSVIGAVTVSPTGRRLGAYFQVFDRNVVTEDAELFVWGLHQKLRRPLLVVWDNLNVHYAAQKQLRDVVDRIDFAYLPPYAPQLNPVEALWSLTKYGRMANWCPPDAWTLATRVRDELLDIRSEQRLLRGLFRAVSMSLD